MGVAQVLLKHWPPFKKPVPVIDYPTSKKTLPNVQFIPLLVQLWIIPINPIAGSQQERISISFLRDLLGAMRSPKVLSSPKQTQSSQLLLRGGAFQFFHQLGCPGLVVLKCLSTPLTAQLLTGRPWQCQIQLDNPLSWLSGCAVRCTQRWSLPSWLSGHMLQHVNQDNKDPETPLCVNALQSLLSQGKLVSSVTLFQLQSPAFVPFNVLPLVIAQCSSLSRPLCKASCTLRKPTAPWCHQQSC